jgi:peptidoglycan/LPS O-acetylase OafA/YrhL
VPDDHAGGRHVEDDAMTIAAPARELLSSDLRPTGRSEASPTPFRADIEGLRGLAVLLVVLYHAQIGIARGGFVGVDVFFALSGFLITGLLVDHRSGAGTGALTAFYARRIRRLLPASAFVFVSTVLLSVALLPALQLGGLRGQARAVAVYGANIWFARDAVDYLRSANLSPFQQYWSLALEEQFYLVWPFLLAVFAFRSGREAMLRRLLVGIGVVVVASFAVSIAWTHSNQPAAFFLLPSRAWQLGLGALLAVAVRAGFRVPASIARPIGWMGIAAVLGAAVLFSDSTSYPGWPALLPVAGTLAVLVSGASPGGGNELLESSELRWFGKYSYSLYLWHWPLLVIAAAKAEVPLARLGSPTRAAMVGLSVVAAVATFHLVEQRVRFAPSLMASAPRSFALGVGLTVVSLLATMLLTSTVGMNQLPADSGRPPKPDGVRSTYVPVGMRPSLLEGYHELPRLQRDGCMIYYEDVTPNPCRRDHSGPRVVLLGDSHAAQWSTALLAGDWSVTTYLKATCPATGLPYELDYLKRAYTECERWNDSVVDEMAADPPDLVIIAHYSRFYDGIVGRDEWLAATDRMTRRIGAFSPVVVLRDTPDDERFTKTTDTAECLGKHLDDVTPCEPRNDDTDELAAAEQRTVETAGGIYVDPDVFVCPTDPCASVVGDIRVYRDTNHLTDTYVKSQAAKFNQLITEALAGRDR